MAMTAEERTAKRRETSRLWRLANRDRQRELERAYKEQNRELLARRAKEYRLNHPDRVRESRRKHREVNREKFRARYQKERKQALEAYGSQCVCCGETALCFLTIDHVANDGAKHRRTKDETGEYHGNGYAIYRWLRKHKYPDDGRFQVLCYNCNCCKQHNPAGHRAAHPNAVNIDGLGDLSGKKNQET